MDLGDDDWDLSAEDLDSLERNALQQFSQCRNPLPSPSPSPSPSLSKTKQVQPNTEARSFVSTPTKPLNKVNPFPKFEPWFISCLELLIFMAIQRSLYEMYMSLVVWYGQSRRY